MYLPALSGVCVQLQEMDETLYRSLVHGYKREGQVTQFWPTLTRENLP